MNQKSKLSATKTEYYRSYIVKEHERKMYERVYKESLRRMRSREMKERVMLCVVRAMAMNVMVKQAHVVEVNNGYTYPWQSE